MTQSMDSQVPSCPLCWATSAARFCEVRGQTYFQCPLCKLVFLDPTQRPNSEEERQEYLLHNNDPSCSGYRRHLQQLAEPLAAQLPANSTGLDYGCGPTASMSVLLGEMGHRVVDYDPLFNSNPQALTRTYDFVTCSEVVEHFHEPRRDFARLAQLLTPGGLLGIMTELHTDAIDFPKWHYIREQSHVCFYSPETMRWLGTHFGWHVSIVSLRIVLARKPEVETES